MPTTLAFGPLVFWFTALTIKHVVADFPLQSQWMAFGKDQRTRWFAPLVAHCATHGALTTLLIAVVEPRLWYLGLVDFAIHITTDRCKGLLMQRQRLTPSDSRFWTIIGVDQALHHMTGFALAIVLTAQL